MDDMYIDESLTETTEILFDCPECGYVSGEIWERCQKCEEDQNDENKIN